MLQPCSFWMILFDSSACIPLILTRLRAHVIGIHLKHIFNIEEKERLSWILKGEERGILNEELFNILQPTKDQMRDQPTPHRHSCFPGLLDMIGRQKIATIFFFKMSNLTDGKNIYAWAQNGFYNLTNVQLCSSQVNKGKSGCQKKWFDQFSRHFRPFPEEFFF